MRTRTLAAGGFGLLSLTLLACSSNTTSVGSLTGSGGSGAGSTTSSTGGGGGGAPLAKATKIDLLLVVDNSRSMADKQSLLAASVADLTGRLVNPLCLDGDGTPSSQQPATGLDPCPPGAEREFTPVFDIHMGVITSSLGGHGADACAVIPGQEWFYTQSNNDRGHLIARLDPTAPGDAPTYQGQGFLAWDPVAAMSPPGESVYGNLVQTFSDMVVGAGQIGCGYESVLESWYRFLVDPAPYETIYANLGPVVTTGVDTVLLEQRRAFLRPDSMLVIVMLSDENDCSTMESGQFYISNQLNLPNGPYHLPAARAICQTNPNDACCRSCGQPAGEDALGNACPDDPTCATLDNLNDDANLRCFDQKRRFGIDFLYPIDRYTQALTQATIADAQGQLVPNPIFSDLDPTDDNSTIRDPGLVVVTGILGVPWQDLARDPGDLAQGFKSADELAQTIPGAGTTWDVILGDPANYVAPLDPLMRESVAPRIGTNPITGDPTALPGFPLGNPMNGNEFSVPMQDDLQYACITSLPTARDCGPGSTEIGGCDCDGTNLDNPLCEIDPVTNDRTLQVRAKAYPGVRQLSLLKSLGDQAVVTSICTPQVEDPTSTTFAYRQNSASVVERMKLRL